MVSEKPAQGGSLVPVHVIEDHVPEEIINIIKPTLKQSYISNVDFLAVLCCSVFKQHILGNALEIFIS